MFIGNVLPAFDETSSRLEDDPVVPVLVIVFVALAPFDGMKTNSLSCDSTGTVS